MKGYDEEEGEIEEPMSLSSDEIHDHRSNAAGSTKIVPTRPRSQGDNDRKNEKRKRQLPRGGDDRKRWQPGEVGGTQGASGGEREGNTWRGRLEGEGRRRGHEKGPALSSGKKFEDLDNYLRGCGSAAEAKQNKRERVSKFGRYGRLERNLSGKNLGKGESSLAYAEGDEVRVQKRSAKRKSHVASTVVV